jgi:UDP-N-acetylmuramoyl-tripeptide--D-alanyl-D-alanine ligase
MIEMRLADVAAVTGGRLHRASGDERVTAVEFDSRSAGPGTLFLTLPGARVDGHDFVPAVLEAGATGVLTARELDAPGVVVPLGRRSTDTYLGAADPDGSGAGVLAALAALARHQTANLPELRTVGITGSAGKTSTKDLVAALLAPLGPLVAPPGSFNTELGMPWTALRADGSTRTLVLEYSARRAGHIAGMTRVVTPDVAVVLNVGSAHLDEFGSVEGIAQAKGELVEALSPEGVAVLNADDPNVLGMAPRTAGRVVTFGRSPDADVRAEEIHLDAARPRFTLVTATGSAPVALQLVGEHQISNALAAATVALELGVDVETVAKLLTDATPASRWRMEVTERPDGVTIVNDAYNANPDSMRAGLRALEALGAGRRTWAVLGPMGELGAAIDAAYASVATTARETGVAELVAVGPTGYAATFRGTHEVADVDAAVALLREALRPGDVVLIKGGRVAGLERIAAGLLAVPNPAGEAAR